MTYFVTLYSFGEIILAAWQMVFYHLFSSTPTKGAYMGFESAANWFPIINIHALHQTVAIYCFFNVVNFFIFTYGVRKKFPEFSPFRFLNILLKKYNILLGLSVMSISLTIQCMIIIDCGIDVSIEKIRNILS